MATIEKRSRGDGTSSYHVKVRLRGSPAQFATFKRLTDAKKWAQSTEAAIREGRHFPKVEAKRRTFQDVLGQYTKAVRISRPSTLRDRKHQLRFWEKRLGPLLLADITPHHIRKAKNELLSGETIRGTRRSPSTVNRYLAALSHVFGFAVKELGWLDISPFARVKKEREPGGRIRYLSDSERTQLLAACKKSSRRELYLIVVLALSTGMRKGEILNLTWSDVDQERGVILLQNTKNRERRTVPLVAHALDSLAEYSTVRRLDTDLLFPSTTNPQKPIDIRTAWERAIGACEIEDFRFHDLRHSCASYLAMNGATPTEIADVLGHKTLSMVKRYAHLSEQHTREVVANMNERIFS